MKLKFKLGSQSTKTSMNMNFRAGVACLQLPVFLRQLHGSLSSSFQAAQFHTVCPMRLKPRTLNDFVGWWHVDILTYHNSEGSCICEWCWRHALFNLSWLVYGCSSNFWLWLLHPLRSACCSSCEKDKTPQDGQNFTGMRHVFKRLC